jgi:hypothetical protein
MEAPFSSSLDDQIDRLKRCEHLKESEVKILCQKAREILVDESNVQRVDAPVTVSSSFFSKNVSSYTQTKTDCMKDLRRYTWAILRFSRAL